MLRALAASARPLSGGRAWLMASSSSWPRAFATEGSGKALTTEQPAASSSSGGSGSSDQQQQQQQAPPDDGWTEVVDDASGKSYWWNQQTGQTTDLGSARPTERFWRRPAGGGRGAGADEDDYDDSDPHFRDGQGVWKEPPGRDKTWTYSVIGVGIGMAAGWLTQYIH